MKSGKWTVVWVVCSCRYWTITWLVTHTWLMHESCECDGPVPAATYYLLNCVHCVKAVHKLCPQTSPPFQRILDGVTTLIASVSFLPAWRYASALYAMAWRLSVLYWKRMNGSRSCHDALGFSDSVLESNSVFPKWRLLPSGTLSKTLPGLEKCRRASRRQFVTRSVHLCVQHCARRAGPSASAESRPRTTMLLSPSSSSL